MAIESLYETIGLVANYNQSIITGENQIQNLGVFDRDLLSYSHNINTFGGFNTARLVVSLRIEKIEEWLTAGVGRHITIEDSGQQVAWEGFIDKITITIGAASVSVGPLTEIANRVTVVYTEIEPNNPSVAGTSTETLIEEDIDSQRHYGIFDKVMSAGSVTQTEAETIRGVYLQDNKYPRSSCNFSISPGVGEEPTLTLDCKGYYHLFDTFIYNDTSTTFYTGTEKISDVIDAEPNGIVSDTRLDVNAVGVFATEIANRTGLTVVRSVVDLGDSNDNRWVFAVYEGRKVYYQSIPEIIQYTYEMRDENKFVANLFGTRIPPWSIRPNNWILVKDLLTSSARITPTGSVDDLLADPRVTYIESVNYTAPHTLNMAGNRLEKVPQLLAKYGLAAIE